MNNAEKKRKLQKLRRKNRTSFKISGNSERPRMSVRRTLRHIFVQVIDDTKHCTLVYASDLDKEIKAKNLKNKTELAKAVGHLIAEKCQKANITQIVFDRGAARYHGRIQVLADAAREKGLKF